MAETGNTGTTPFSAPGGKLNVAVLFDLTERHKAELKKLAEERCNLRFLKGNAELTPIISEIDVMLGATHPDPALFEKASRLKWMQSGSAGIEAYLDIFRKKKTAVLTNASGAYGESISEHMIAYVLILIKHIQHYVRAQDRHDWNFYGKSRLLSDLLVTVVGLGDLGAKFAQKMHALGARVQGVKHTKAPKPDYLTALYTADELDKALSGADVVALCLPSTDATVGILSRERIFALKQDAIVLNTGRGTAVDQNALCDALREKRIYAGLDVTSPEPLPQVHPMWSLENLFLTPHITGGPSSHDYAQEFIGELILRNMKAYLEGRALENVVDLARGY
jgi:phosphoglycerate dehydrogenase-like enzyme